MKVKKHTIQKHLKPNGRDLSCVFQVGCNYRILDPWLQIFGSETWTNISCKLIKTALEIFKYEGSPLGKVVMMAFWCFGSSTKKSWINSPEMEVTHWSLLTKATCMKDKDEIARQHFWYIFCWWKPLGCADGHFETWPKQQEKALHCL